MFNFYKSNIDLYNSRSLCMFLLAYVGFFRYKELSNIRMTNIAFMIHILKYLLKLARQIFIDKAIKFVIVRTNTEPCPVLFMRCHCTLAGLNLDSTEYIFRSLQYNKSNHRCTISKINKPLSYTRSRELFLEAVSAIALDKTLFG